MILHYRPVENTLILRGFCKDRTREWAFLQGNSRLVVPKWPNDAYKSSYWEQYPVPSTQSQALAAFSILASMLLGRGF